ncbi:HDOD domain-containing protein [Pelagicoccus sp. SDUM812003]|uniref:HDOD domain-containing protein n=1 Tax=Pelagicoccus sp. SDUM812003 TaxID=3041267 RepID=UPI00280E0422|nr:HDOD domain-containing protein [Pelagicoccus sp. SDUM812003]MDQ8202123.1 HDOD domain-containing protein [Pelagicoccus sp. SDUM812003]
MGQKEFGSLPQATDWVCRHPELSLRLLKNVPEDYDGDASAMSVDSALRTMGLTRVGEMALSWSYWELVPRELPVYGLSREEFFLQAHAGAVAMQLFNDQGELGALEAFAIGLLHGAGMLAIDRALQSRSKETPRLAAETPRKLADLEKTLLGTEHAWVGGSLLARWSLSEEIVRPVARQFDGEGSDLQQRLSISRYIANRVVDAARGARSPLGSKENVIYRGYSLYQVFEYAKKRSKQSFAGLN